jgi:hypothetical protein
MQLASVFRLEEKRTVSNDWVVRYDNRFFQLERQSGRPPAGSTVLVYEASDGAIEIRYRDRAMRWTEVLPQPHTETAVVPSPTRSTPPLSGAVRMKPRRVCDGHPWRRAVEQFRIDQQLAADRKAHAMVNP